jgi:predicted metallopeptidase
MSKGQHAIFQEAPDLKELAKKVIAAREEVGHIDVEEVLFLKEIATMPKAAARCYSFYHHPINFFTKERFGIVFYESNIVHFTEKQRAILMFHELSHIPILGDKLIDHNIKDFYEVLQLGIDWARNGADVPDILNKED